VAEGGELERDFDDLPPNTGTLEAGYASDITGLRLGGTSALSFQQSLPIATFSIFAEVSNLEVCGCPSLPITEHAPHQRGVWLASFNVRRFA
jgi:hypothetical protein